MSSLVGDAGARNMDGVFAGVSPFSSDTRLLKESTGERDLHLDQLQRANRVTNAERETWNCSAT